MSPQEERLEEGRRRDHRAEVEELDESVLDDLEEEEAEDEQAEPDEDEIVAAGEEDAEVMTSGDAFDDEEEASLEVLVDREKAQSRADGSEEEDDGDIISFGEDDEPVGEPLPSRVVPIKDRQEFVCRSCYLVKARSQLADPERTLCRDCA